MAIPITLGMINAVWGSLRWIWKHTVYKAGNFQFIFLNHLPIQQYNSPVIEEPITDIKILPPGSHKLAIRIRSEYGFQVKKVNFRCLTTEGRNLEQGIVQIRDVEDPFNPRLLDVHQDGYWGLDGEYRNTRGLAQGECLYFEITLDAIQACCVSSRQTQ